MKNNGFVRALMVVGVISLVAGAPSLGVVSAATASANLSVSATVTNNCTVSTAALAFGSYDPVVANATAGLDGTGRLLGIGMVADGSLQPEKVVGAVAVEA